MAPMWLTVQIHAQVTRDCLITLRRGILGQESSACIENLCLVDCSLPPGMLCPLFPNMCIKRIAVVLCHTAQHVQKPGPASLVSTPSALTSSSAHAHADAFRLLNAADGLKAQLKRLDLSMNASLGCDGACLALLPATTLQSIVSAT